MEIFQKFNETCCEEYGVPEECMVNCREKIQGRGITLVEPKGQCSEHSQTIKDCLYVPSKGKY